MHNVFGSTSTKTGIPPLRIIACAVEINEREGKIETFLNSKKNNFNECVICLEDMKTNEELTILLCSHIYHFCFTDNIKTAG